MSNRRRHVLDLRVTPASKGDLRPQRDGVEIAAELGARGRAFIDDAVQIIEHEPHVRVGIPVHAHRVDRLAAAADAVAAGGNGNTGLEVVVEMTSL